MYELRLKTNAALLGYGLKVVDLSQALDLKHTLSKVDAILVPGGADIDPKYYVEQVTPELRKYTEENLKLVSFSDEGRERDPFEYDLLKNYSEDDSYKDLPLLGICRGMQMMGVSQGVPLYLDIKTELKIKNRRYLFDRIQDLAPNSRMSSIYKKSGFKGYKFHHQGIRVPYWNEHKNDYPQVKVTAFSHEGKIAEALEYTHRKAVGVQYHPEMSFTSTTYPIFKWFLNQACEYKKSQKDLL